MTPQFSADEKGRLVVTLFKLVQREQAYLVEVASRKFPQIRFAEFSRLSEHFSITNSRKLLLARRLQRAGELFDLKSDIRRTPADSAIARWLVAKRGSIKRLARLSPAKPSRIEGHALAMMSAVGHDWLAEATDKELLRCGISLVPTDSTASADLTSNDLTHASSSASGEQNPGDGLWVRRFVDSRGANHIEANLEREIRRWFEMAPFIYRLSGLTVDYLVRRKGPAGTMPSDTALPERRQLLGRDLPRLYELVCLEKFGVSKEGDRVKDTTGVSFVIRAAAALGMRVSTEMVFEHHKKVRQVTRRDGVALSKSNRRLPRDARPKKP